MYRLHYVLGDAKRITDLVEIGALQTFGAAKSEAITIARELAADLLRSGKPVDGGVIQICDLGDRVLFIIALKEAVHPINGFDADSSTYGDEG